MNTHILARVALFSGCLFPIGCGQDPAHESLPRSNVEESRERSESGELSRESTASTKNLESPSDNDASASTGAAPGWKSKSASSQRDSQLTLHVQFDKRDDDAIEIHDAFGITLKNSSDQPIRIWNPDTPNGYYQLEFRLMNLRTGQTHKLCHTRIDDDEFWRWYEEDIEPEEETIDIAPGGKYTFDEGWGDSQGEYRIWTGLPDPNSDDRFAISAEFASSLEASDAARPVWNGSIKTDVITARLVASDLKTPYDYLRDDFPNKALEMIKADQSWIGRLDEHQLTPLHVAATYGHAEVVKWLLENGADVNAIAYNGFTPLHVTDDPDVISVILEHKPNLSIRCRVQGQTPLQSAVDRLVYARNASDKQKWERIARLYRDAGADYDLLVAIHLDDLERVKSILTESPPLADDFQGQSPLRAAASLGRLEICQYLIRQHRVDVNDFERGVGYPIIKEALAYPEIVRLLIDSGADLQTRITWRGGRSGIWIIGDDATALHFAANDGVPETIRLLIDNGVDVFATAHELGDENDKQTALEVAAYFGKADNARAILDHPKFREADASTRKALLDKCLLTGAFPSWLAREPNRPELIAELLKHGADPNASQDGVTAVQIAARQIRPDSKRENQEINKVIAILAERGATLDLFSAVATGDEERVRRLLKENPDSANARGPDGYPALHFAIGMNFQGVVQQLLEAGCDVEIRSTSDETGSKGETALHCAAFWGRTEIAKLLIDAGADVNALSEGHATPLHDAARMTNVRMIRLLLDNGANMNAQDKDGETPLDWAYSPDEVKDVLKEYEGTVIRIPKD